MFNMYYYLKNLTPSQQIGALFVLVFGLLLLASVVAFLYSVRDHGDSPEAQAQRKELRRMEGLLLDKLQHLVDHLARHRVLYVR